jgi:hypothetical protein
MHAQQIYLGKKQTHTTLVVPSGGHVSSAWVFDCCHIASDNQLMEKMN